jgi:starvation-inducible DNA-binding protein
MLAELREDNRAMLASMREVHDLCDEEKDVATTSLLENWIVMFGRLHRSVSWPC